MSHDFWHLIEMTLYDFFFIFFPPALFVCFPITCQINCCAQAQSKEMIVCREVNLELFPDLNCLNFQNN